MESIKVFDLIPNPDGTLTRTTIFTNAPPTGYVDSTPPQTIATIDVPLNTTNDTWIRIFHPLNLPSITTKLPVIINFPGCGFVLDTARILPVNEFFKRMASELPALVLTVKHRLAPESRLPSAYEDAVDAMLWLKQQALHGELKFSHFADFTRCYLMGNSSGGNIVYKTGLRALSLDLEPVKIQGLIMDQPFFGGVERTESEVKYVNDPMLPLQATDIMWEFSLPIGADRNHEYSNPMLDGSNSGEIRMLPRCYVNGHTGDPLVDRQKEFVKMLEANGVSVVTHFVDDGFHAIELFDPEKAGALVKSIREFVYSSVSGPDDNVTVKI